MHAFDSHFISQVQKNIISVSGTVKDAKGEPLIGVSVLVKGTTNGTVTDLDGKFSLKVSVGDTLEFSYIGYVSQSVTVANTNPLNIVLGEDTQTLDEVVVTALGIKRAEKALSYNVQQVKSEELVRTKDANFINSLNGKIAGVTINKSASGAGGSARVVMRGAKSIEGDNSALYVIDGIPLFNTTLGTGSDVLGDGRATTEGIADFNPEDIESISVLSGPSAAALYGSSAANGVILINTKKGKEGKLSVSFSSSTEFSKAYMTPDFQTVYRNRDGAYESWGDKMATPTSYDPKKDFFNTGTNFINSLTLTTGTKQNQTFASISSTNSTGIVPNNTYDRLNFTIRNTSTFLNDKLQLDLGASYVKQKDQNMVSQGQYWNPVMAAYLFPRGESWEAIKTFERENPGRNIAEQYWPVSEGTYASQNPYWTAYRNVAPSEKSRYMFNVGLTYKIFDWMNVAARYRMDDSYIDFERKIYASSNDVFTEGSKKGLYEYNNYKDRQEYADFMVNINKQIADFNISANLGYSYSNYWAQSRGYRGPLLLVPNMFAASNIDSSKGRVMESEGDSRVRNNAVFANVELGYKSMLYLTLTGRNDWNSRLVNTDEESFFYPSIGLSAIVSEMFDLPRFISYLKVRGSYTEVGAPISRSGLTPGTVTTPITGGALEENLIYPFTDFKAERTRSYEFGLSLRLWSKFSAELTYYKSNTYNQTFLGDLPEYSGYKQIYLQAGNVENRGWEASLGYSDKFGDFSLSSSLTFSRNINEIKEMVENYHTDMSLEPINIPEVRKDNGRTLLKVGGSIHDIYADRFFKKDSQGFVEIKEDGSYGMENVEPVFLGKTTPDFNMGWNNSFSYKGFGLSFLINGRFGGVVTSSTEALLDRFGVSKASGEARDLGGALLPGQGRVDAETYYKMIGTGEYSTSGYYVYSATNIRLQELTLSYTFPNSWFKNVLKDVTLSFTANNPWMIYCKAPFDPELTPSVGTYGQGNDYFMQPSVRSFGFGIKLKL
jgi:Outer membrane receptor proteins, mostly Fe transport